jgi:hypothetical protein
LGQDPTAGAASDHHKVDLVLQVESAHLFA